MCKLLPGLSFLVALGFGVQIQQAGGGGQTSPAAPPKAAADAAKQTNPVKPTPESIAEGKRWFNIDCAMCHGKQGDGKGDLAQDMKLKLKDYRDPEALKDMTDGELYNIILKGKGEMTAGEEGRAKPGDIWNMVNYIRSVAKKQQTEDKEPKETPPKPN